MDIKTLHTEYDCVAPRAKRLEEALLSELGHLLGQYSVTLGVPMEGRVKEWSSIEEKITRKSLSLTGIADLDDLVGIRIILLFRRDLSSVDRLVRESLKVLSVEDTAQRLAETQFGYQSQHYVVQVPDAWLKLPSYADLHGIKIELQVRTLAQHIWAAASHKLQYKHEASVPAPLRRSIHRASALLETVDLEFDRLLDERLTYVSKQLPMTSDDDALNVDIIQSILDELLPARNKRADEQYDDLFKDLRHFGVDTANKLRPILTKHKDAILASDAEMARKNKKAAYFTHVGLVREGLRQEYGKKAVDDFHKQGRSARRRRPNAPQES